MSDGVQIQQGSAFFGILGNDFKVPIFLPECEIEIRSLSSIHLHELWRELHKEGVQLRAKGLDYFLSNEMSLCLVVKNSVCFMPI
jgi:hypothetical protein